MKKLTIKNMEYKYIDTPDENGKPQHLHLLNEVALTGTSSIVGILSKPLSYWASGKACAELGWIKKLDSRKSKPEELMENSKNRLESAELWREKIWTMSPVEYLALLDSAYKAHATSLKDSAKSGVDLHAELERFVKSCIKKDTFYKDRFDDFDKKIHPFIKWADENVKKFIASECHCYSERLWIGGIIDCVAELKDDTLAVIDFKSSREAYISQFIQTELYAIQAEENGMFDKSGEHNKKMSKKIENLIVVPFGGEVVTPEIRKNLVDYKEGAEAAVKLYRLMGIDEKIKYK